MMDPQSKKQKTTVRLVTCFTDGSLSDEINKQIQKDKTIKKTEQARQFRSILDQYRPSTLNIGSEKGDYYMDTILFYLDKLMRSPSQKDMHSYFLGSCIRAIYGEGYKKNRSRVVDKYKLPTRKQQMLVCCPRRFGKTFGVAYFAVVMAIVLPNIEISIFSPGRRQSSALMGVIHKFLKKLNEQSRILVKNEEKMVVQTLSGEESKINAYPGAVRTLKGVSATIVIMEEMAQIDEDVMFEVVMPLLQLEVTTLIGISTITGEDNIMTRFMEMKDNNGDPLFETKRMYLMCEPCREAGVGSTCTHLLNLLPPWSSGRKRRIVSCLMKDHQAMLEREIGGFASETLKAFDSKLVKALRTKPKWHPVGYEHQKCVFISIDPSGCGDSDFAVASFIFLQGKFVLVGAEAYPIGSAAESEELLLKHIRELERISYFTNARKLFIIENNYGNEAERLETFLTANIRNFHVLREKPTKAGFATSHNNKSSAVDRFRDQLGGDAFFISNSSAFACITRDYNSTIDFLVHQLSCFSENVVDNSRKMGTHPKRFYTGKTVGSKDDLVMALLLAFLWIPVFNGSDYYAHIRNSL